MGTAREALDPEVAMGAGQRGRMWGLRYRVKTAGIHTGASGGGSTARTGGSRVARTRVRCSDRAKRGRGAGAAALTKSSGGEWLRADVPGRHGHGCSLSGRERRA